MVAATGKSDAESVLRDLGAREVIGRDEANDTSGKALLNGRWAGAVDTVGGNYLATALKSARYGGVVTCCGNVASPDLALTVYPFILRAVSLVGIDVANCAPEARRQLWHKLAGEWHLERLAQMVSQCTLDDLSSEIERTLRGQRTGRLVLNLIA